MKTNKEIFDEFKSKLEKYGFYMKNINSYDNYSFNNFKLKGFGNWIFAVWVRGCYLEGTEDSESFYFFTMHKDNIDKFKPSRAYFVYGEKIKDNLFNDSPYGFKNNYIDMIKHIKYHRFHAYLQESDEEYFTFWYPLFIRYLINFICNKIWKIKSKIRYFKQEKELKKIMEYRRKHSDTDT